MKFVLRGLVVYSTTVGLPDVLFLEDMSTFLGPVLPFVLPKKFFSKSRKKFMQICKTYFHSHNKRFYVSFPAFNTSSLLWFIIWSIHTFYDINSLLRVKKHKQNEFSGKISLHLQLERKRKVWMKSVIIYLTNFPSIFFGFLAIFK